MEIPKPSDTDKDYFRSLFQDRPEVRMKPMFGNLAAFVDGNDQMCCGLFGEKVGVRLDEESRVELSGVAGTSVFGPADRPMKEYLSLPLEWRDDAAKTDEWIDRAIEYAATLPPKKTKKTKKR